ncbi:hypothetical protein AVEN_256902-1 [Araneus ventricosus]|uniref:Uncharacterized protein n=1 Tax=Araneus ventricosus TaxID=182803 RepID=A0A4Y2CHX5_ARAVE|nr:hypothetical protein AVEN_256902-1 [Araneus ventricosus]
MYTIPLGVESYSFRSLVIENCFTKFMFQPKSRSSDSRELQAQSLIRVGESRKHEFAIQKIHVYDPTRGRNPQYKKPSHRELFYEVHVSRKESGRSRSGGPIPFPANPDRWQQVGRRANTQEKEKRRQHVKDGYTKFGLLLSIVA